MECPYNLTTRASVLFIVGAVYISTWHFFFNWLIWIWDIVVIVTSCFFISFSPSKTNNNVYCRAVYQSRWPIRYLYQYKLIDIRYLIWYLRFLLKMN